MSDARWEVVSDSPDDTHRFGVLLGRLLQGGDLVALHGDLGAGKTTLCAGIGEGLGVAERLRSPSYLLCHEAVGRLPVLHLDAYFEARLDGLLAEGLVERFDSATVVLVEWAERMAAWLPPERLELTLEAGSGDQQRLLRVQALGARPAALLTELRAAWKTGAGT